LNIRLVMKTFLSFDFYGHRIPNVVKRLVKELFLMPCYFLLKFIFALVMESNVMSSPIYLFLLSLTCRYYVKQFAHK
jgi:uncharacterized membrane protein YGL010W